MIARHRALVRVIAGKQLALLKRYWVNTLSGIGTTYLMFLLLFVGGRAVAPATLDESLSGLIVGFFLWSTSWSAFQQPASGITEEAQWGTLEQLYMSPLGFRRVLAIDTAVSLVVGVATSSLLLVAMMLTTGRYLAVDVVTVVPLLALSLCSAVGLGFAMAGLALLYKRISQAFLIVQFLLGAALATPARLPYLALPLALGNDLLRTAMADGRRLWELPDPLLVALVGKAALYLAIGGVLFGLAVRIAKDRGVMGHY